MPEKVKMYCDIDCHLTVLRYIRWWHPRQQSSWGQHGAHLGPVSPRWAPCWPHEPCYQGCWHGKFFGITAHRSPMDPSHKWPVMQSIDVLFPKQDVQHTIRLAIYWSSCDTIPDSKVHGANIVPIWGRQVPGGPHVGPMDYAIWDPNNKSVVYPLILSWNVHFQYFDTIQVLICLISQNSPESKLHLPIIFFPVIIVPAIHISRDSKPSSLSYCR